KTLAAFKETVEATGVEHEWLTPEEVTKRSPQYRLAKDMMAFYHPDAVYLAAERCVRTLPPVAPKHSAVIQTTARVQEVIAHAASVTVRTASESYSAARLIITAGSWSSQLISQLGLNLPLMPTRQQVIYFETQDLAQFEPDRFPV